MLTPPNNNPMSIFEGGKLKSGTYKVQNLASQTYLEVLDHSKELCCRIPTVLTPKDALWEFKALESGYTIKKVDYGKPDQYCNSLGGMALFGFGGIVSVAALPAAWRVELVEDSQYREFGYIRIFWGSTDKVLDLNWWGSAADGTKVALWDNGGSTHPCRIWKLTPVQEDNPLAGSGAKKHDPPPTYSAE